MSITFGTDPEFALLHKGQFKSAIGVLPEKDRAAKEGSNAFYFDNVLAEIGVKPAKSRVETVDNIRSAFKSLAKLVKPAKFVIRASMNYPSSELKHPKAMEAGCVPELSAYTLQRVTPPVEFVVFDEENDRMKHITPFRTVGGHIHMGDTDGPLQNGMLVPYIVKMMDLFVAVPELFFNKDKTSRDRRSVYGIAGTHRQPEYGVEYRPLSNFWLSSPLFVNLIYDLSDFALSTVSDGLHTRFWQIDEDLLDEDDPSVAHRCYGYDCDLLRNAINTFDKKAAEPFMTFIQNYLPNYLIEEIDEAINYYPNDLYEEWSIA